VDEALRREYCQLLIARELALCGPPKSARSRRTIALDEETLKVLQRHRDTQQLERALGGDAYQDLDLVFCWEDGTPIHPQRLTEWFARHRKAAGIPQRTLHVLRHTHTTHLLTNGVPLHVVAARLGDRPETVLRTYAHLLPSSDEQAAKQAAALIG
jgi:integrase